MGSGIVESRLLKDDLEAQAQVEEVAHIVNALAPRLIELSVTKYGSRVVQ